MPFLRRLAFGLGPAALGVLDEAGVFSERRTDAAAGDLLWVVAALGDGAAGEASPSVAVARAAGALVVAVVWAADRAEALAVDRDRAALLACCDTVVQVPPLVRARFADLRGTATTRAADTLRVLADVLPRDAAHLAYERRLRGLLGSGGLARTGAATARGPGRVACAFSSPAREAMAGCAPAALLVVVEGPGDLAAGELVGLQAAARELASGGEVVARVVDSHITGVRVTVVAALGRTGSPAPGSPPRQAPPAHVGVVAVPPVEVDPVPVVHIRTAARDR